MNEKDIQRLLVKMRRSVKGEIALWQTHISWIVLTHRVVYKIKKPVHFSFLDFSTIAQRKRYCKEEVQLNKRLTKGIYKGVVSVKQNEEDIFIGNGRGKVIDFAVQLKRLDSSKQMNVLLRENRLKEKSIQSIAKLLASFHGRTKVIYRSFDLDHLSREFNEIISIKKVVIQQLDKRYLSVINRAIIYFNQYINEHKEWLQTRSKEGYIRDCHGDLHAGNIFVYAKPIIFDCIEFNKEFRYIDVLNEIAFLCMDLEVYKKNKLSNLLVKYYCHYTGHVLQTKEKKLLLFYKLYRASVRAKITAIELMQLPGKEREKELNKDLKNYLDQMQIYLKD
ncbi:MAG: hypothetical protein JWO58_1613 [Chitinophagaceae bacterium]|nr:hypothetical protein [Chitinophagaceae bacterium]